MNEKWMRPVELMEILMNFLTVFCVETALFSALVPLEGALEGEVLQAGSGMLQPPALLLQLLLAAVPVCFWLIRIFASRFWLFALLHGAVWGSTVLGLGQNGVQRGIFGIFAGIYLLVSFRVRLQEGREEEGLLGPAAALIAASLAVLLCAYLGDSAACGRILNASLAYAFLFFADTYLRNLERFVQFNKSSNAHIPVRRMLLRGGGLTAACSLGVVMLLALGADQTFMDRAGELLQNVSLWVIRGVLKLIGFLLDLFGAEGGVQETAPQESAAMEFMAAETREHPFWLEILYQVVQYLLLIGAAALLVFLVYQAVSALIRRFYEGKIRRTQDEQKTEEIRETLRAEKRKRDRQDTVRLFARTPEEKIRRIFVRTIQRSERFRNPEGHPGSGALFPRGTAFREKNLWGKDQWRTDARESLLHAKTAREMEFLFAEAGTGDGEEAEGDKQAFRELARLYERARYARTKVPGAREPYKEPACTGANIAEPGAGDMDAGHTDGALGAEDVKRAEACRDVLLGRRRR
ncbi:MAG TPA: hypothetical protein H9761_04240 [Candidatus Eisenbergiella merdavium]|uniref:DUF4129 domain-containing protein n=1 Tax=Candidatus Eisenbergiella merdavium TaxID=2838551 RepID=A0A9D2NDS1_9FIRM|nr:hypothetical protein [Candidatus Eisenbergiella merdavium]